MRFFAFWAVLFGWPLLAGAQTMDAVVDSLVGTHLFEFQEKTSGGKTVGCSWEFSLLHRDYAYAKGGPVQLLGSFTIFFESGKVPSLGVKVGGKDVTFPGRTTNFSWFDVPFATLRANGRSMAGREQVKFQCEDRHSRCIGYVNEAMADILDAIAADRIEFLYSRREGGLDAQAKLAIAQVKDGGDQLGNGINCIQRQLRGR
jgi:hypothetical protein